MTWVKIDEDFYQHPKVIQAGPLAMALQVAGLCYCNRNLTDGFVPWAAARGLLTWEFLEAPEGDGRQRRKTISTTCGMQGDDVSSEYVIGLLLNAGMWEEAVGGYRIHDFPEYQLTKEEVLALRQQRVEAGKASGEARRERAVQRKANAVLNETQGRPKSEQVAERKLNETRTGQNQSERNLNEVLNGKSNETRTKPEPVPVPVPDPLDHVKRSDLNKTTATAKEPLHGPPPSPLFEAVMAIWPGAGATFYQGYTDLEEEYGADFLWDCWRAALQSGQTKPSVRYLDAVARRCKAEGRMPLEKQDLRDECREEPDNRPTEIEGQRIVGWSAGLPILDAPAKAP
jgi:hypothetical protein